MKLETFAMERLQSEWEHRVAWNLAESGVHPLRVEELVESEDDRMALLAQPLGYPQSNGTVELRTPIASMYPGAGAEHVQVTTGGSEANCITLMHLLAPGDDVVVMMPNYLQVRGLARGLQANVHHWQLVDDSGSNAPKWRLDLDRLRALVTPRVPGDHFEMDGYIRIGFGCDPDLLLPALEHVGEVLDGIETPPTIQSAHAR